MVKITTMLQYNPNNLLTPSSKYMIEIGLVENVVGIKTRKTAL
jgi:hypothetical protein